LVFASQIEASPPLKWDAFWIGVPFYSIIPQKNLRPEARSKVLCYFMIAIDQKA